MGDCCSLACLMGWICLVRNLSFGGVILLHIGWLISGWMVSKIRI